MAKLNLSLEEVQAEIERLKKSKYVALARKELALKKKLYDLRSLEKKGKEIAKEKNIEVE